MQKMVDAMEVLVQIDQFTGGSWEHLTWEAITAGKEALAQHPMDYDQGFVDGVEEGLAMAQPQDIDCPCGSECEKCSARCLPQGEPVAKPFGWWGKREHGINFTTDPDEELKYKYWQPLYTTPPSVEAAMSELQHKYDELLEHYTWQGNQYMEAMRNKASEIEAAIEATKEKAAKLCEELWANDKHNAVSGADICAAAIRSMK